MRSISKPSFWKVTRGTLIGISLCLFSLLHVASVPAQDGAKPARKLESATLGLSAKHVLNLPIYLAQKHGIFESEGLDLKLITTKTSTAIAALVSGDFFSTLRPRPLR